MSLHVPLNVRLATARADIHVTKDLKDLRFRSVVPGGFASASFQLDRSLALDPDEIQPFGDVFIYDGRSASTVWQGRLEDPGRGVSLDGQTWTVTAVGPSAHARDQTVPLIYIDRSLERWRGPSQFVNSRWRYEITEHDDGTTEDLAALQIHVPRNTVVTTGTSDIGDFIYRELKRTGQHIARFRFDHVEGVTATDWKIKAAMRLDSGAATAEETDNASTTAGTIAVSLGIEWVGASDYNICHVRLDRDTSNVTVADDATWMKAWDVVVRAVLKDASGSDITSGYTSNSVLASEVVADLLGRLLNRFDGANASIATTTHAIQQLAYPDGVTPEQVLNDLMTFESDYYWAAWEGDPAKFEWRQWPTTVRYEASAVDGFDSPGSSGDVYDEVTVRYRDPDGRVRTTTRTQTVQALIDAGITRTAIIDLGDDTGTLLNAQRAGDRFLADHASAPNAGMLTVKRPILDSDAGRAVEPFEIRPGHLIRVRDVKPRVDALNASSRDAVTVFRVVGVDYSPNEGAVLELDSPARTLRQIVGRKPVQRRR